MCTCTQRSDTCTTPLLHVTKSSFNFLYYPNCKNKMEMKEITRYKKSGHNNAVLPQLLQTRCIYCDVISKSTSYKTSKHIPCGSKNIYDIIT